MVHGEFQTDRLTPKSNTFQNKIMFRENQITFLYKESLLSSFRFSFSSLFPSFYEFLSVKHRPDTILEAGDGLYNTRKMAKDMLACW